MITLPVHGWGVKGKANGAVGADRTEAGGPRSFPGGGIEEAGDANRFRKIQPSELAPKGGGGGVIGASRLDGGVERPDAAGREARHNPRLPAATPEVNAAVTADPGGLSAIRDVLASIAEAQIAAPIVEAVPVGVVDLQMRRCVENEAVHPNVLLSADLDGAERVQQPAPVTAGAPAELADLAVVDLIDECDQAAAQGNFANSERRFPRLTHIGHVLGPLMRALGVAPADSEDGKAEDPRRRHG